MINQDLIRYPLDPTGVSRNNYVNKEPHTLDNRKYRVIVLTHGAYFEETVNVFDVGRQVQLAKGIDYQCTDMYELPTSKFGKVICGTICVTNLEVSSTIEVSYNALGGEFSNNTELIAQMIKTLEMDKRPVNYQNILNLPEGFIPAEHLHDIGDLYGFEYVVEAINRLGKVMLMGVDLQRDSIMDYVDQRIASNNSRSNRAYAQFRLEG